MGDTVQFILGALSGSLADLLDALFHMEFWKILGGAVVLTLSLVAISTLPDDFRNRVKFFIIVALALFAAIEIFRPFDFRAIPG